MKRVPLLIVCAILAAAVAAGIWWFTARSRGQGGSEADESDRDLTAVTSSSSAATTAASSSSEGTSDSATDAVSEEVLPPVRRAAGDAASKLTAAEGAQLREDVFREEDRVFARSPTYDERRDEMLAKAQAVLDRVGASDGKAIIGAAQAELDAFWNAGGLSAAESYDHGYLARAIVECALEKAPEDFQLLDLYKEAISTTAPNYVVDEDAKSDPAVQERVAQTMRELFEVAERQRSLIVSGKVPPSPEAMLAMHDFTWLAYRGQDYKAGDEALRWLVENATACRCESMKGMFEAILKMAEEKGARPMGNVYIDTERNRRKQAASSRRIPSFRGPPDRRAQIVGLWETEGGNFSITFK